MFSKKTTRPKHSMSSSKTTPLDDQMEIHSLVDYTDSYNKHRKVAVGSAMVTVILIVSSMILQDYVRRDGYQFGLMGYWNTDDEFTAYNDVMNDAGLYCRSAARQVVIYSWLILTLESLGAFLILVMVFLTKDLYKHRKIVPILSGITFSILLPVTLCGFVILDTSYLFEDYIDKEDDHILEGNAEYSNSMVMITLAFFCFILTIYATARALGLKILNSTPTEESTDIPQEFTSYEVDDQGLTAYTIIFALHFKFKRAKVGLTLPQRYFLYIGSVFISLMQLMIVWYLMDEERHDSYIYDGNEDFLGSRFILMLFITIFIGRSVLMAAQRGAAFCVLPPEFFGNFEGHPTFGSRLQRIGYRFLGLLFVAMEIITAHSTVMLAILYTMRISDEEKLTGIVQNFTAVIIVSDFDDLAGSALIALVGVYTHTNVATQLTNIQQEFEERSADQMKTYADSLSLKTKLVFTIVVAQGLGALLQGAFFMHNWVYQAYQCTEEYPPTL